MFSVGDIVLGGVDLNNSLQWTDKFSYTGVVGNRRRTLAGGLVIFSQDIEAGRPVTLNASLDTGWFTFGMVEAIQALAISSGSTYTLNFHGEIYDVRFDYEARPVEFTPLVPKNQGYGATTDFFIGTVRLITV